MYHSSGTVSESQNRKITDSKSKNVSSWYSKQLNTCGIIPGALFLNLRVAALISSSVGL